MKARATPEELQSQIEAAVAEAEALQAKANDGSITPEEQTKLDELLASIEALQKELEAANSAQRIQNIKDRSMQPTRSAPRVITESRTKDPKGTFGEGLRYWLMSHGDNAQMTTEAFNRTREHGFQIGSNRARVPCSYHNLAFKNRTVLTTGGSGSGTEWKYKTYSDKVVEYLTLTSPLVGLVGNDSTADGNARDYFKINDTAMISTYTSASNGTESNPTVPDTNIASAAVTLNTFSITSGYQKISFEELQDVHAAIKIEDKIALANSNSHARLIETDLINGTGNGTTGVQGLLAVDNSVGSVSAASLDEDDLLDIYYAIPAQYRANAIWLASDDTQKVLRQQLRDENGRSLFDKNVVDGVEYSVLLDKKFVVSAYMPDDLLLFFVPEHYMLRMVEGQIFQVFDEKFFPHKAFAGMARFGGGWLGLTGSSGTCHSLTLTS